MIFAGSAMKRAWRPAVRQEGFPPVSAASRHRRKGPYFL